jgi:purine-binding chemotaxis protein CheW
VQRYVEERVMKAALEAKQDVSNAGQYLTFFIAGEEYAANILKVREVIEYDTLTAVPNTPVWIRGVVNLRGSVVPVVDLGVKFGLPASAISRFSCIVITEVDSDGEKLTLGVLADSVSRVIEFSQNEIEEPPAFGTRVKIEYLLGLGAIGKKFCQILDIDKVLSADELLAVTDSLETSASHTENSQGEPVEKKKRKGEKGV